MSGDDKDLSQDSGELPDLDVCHGSVTDSDLDDLHLSQMGVGDSQESNEGHDPRKRRRSASSTSENTTGQGPSKRRRSLSSDTPKTPRAAFFQNWDSNEDITKIDQRFRQVERRFPGPAGLLPVLSSKEVLLLNKPDNPVSQHISKLLATELNQQSSGNMMEKHLPLKHISSQDENILKLSRAPWRELLHALELDPLDPMELNQLMTVKWLHRKLAKHPVSTKIPFLALVLQEEPEVLRTKRTKLSEKRKNPNLKLMDSTGTVTAAIDAAIVNSFGSEFVPGAGIAIQNASFLRFKRQLIVVITKKNLVCITSPKREQVSVPRNLEDHEAVPTTSPVVSAAKTKKSETPLPKIMETLSGVRILKFAEFSKVKVLKAYNDICAAHPDIVLARQKEDADEEESPPESPPRTLFNAFKKPFPPADKRVVPATVTTPTEPLSTVEPSSTQEEDFDPFSAFGDDDDFMEVLNAMDSSENLI